MRRHFLTAAAATVALTGLMTGGTHLFATPASGFSGTTISLGRFGDINVMHQLVTENEHHRRDLWLSLQRTKGESDLYVQSNVWAPGGTTGWHTHPGHSLITVTAGAVTVYEADDETCTPHTYSVGMGFVDEGGDHVHLIRNEGAVEARTTAVQLIPAGATRRIDAEAPAGCRF
jgi:predicted metal-dependent enzyme (double-stranded beta helix superfamily)